MVQILNLLIRYFRMRGCLTMFEQIFDIAKHWAFTEMMGLRNQKVGTSEMDPCSHSFALFNDLMALSL